VYRRSFDRHQQQNPSTRGERLIERGREVGGPPPPPRGARRGGGASARRPAGHPLTSSHEPRPGDKTKRTSVPPGVRTRRGIVLAVLLVGTGGSAAFFANRAATRPGSTSQASRAAESARSEKIQRLGRDTVIVPPDVARHMGIHSATVSDTSRPIQLPPLQGCLALDNNKLSRVHSRFAGE